MKSEPSLLSESESEEPDVLEELAVRELAVRRRLVRAVLPALRLLDRVSRGQEKFGNDHQIRACVALARLAAHVVAGRGVPAQEDEDENPYFSSPEFNTPERLLAGRRLAYLESLTPEQHEEFAANREALIKAWEASKPDPVKEPEAYKDYIHSGKCKHISEVHDEAWPPHLRESSLKKEASDE